MPPALPRREALAGIGGALGLGAGLGVLRPGALMAAPAGRAPDPDDLAAGRADFDARFAAFRAGAGLPRLARDPALEAAAQGHAMTLAGQGLIDHVGHDGSSVGDRARDAGYAWCWVAENLTLNWRGADQVLAAWRGSPGHHANMVSPQAADYGVGFAYVMSGAWRDAPVWVWVAGQRCG